MSKLIKYGALMGMAFLSINAFSQQSTNNQQIKDEVVIIRPELTQEQKDFMESYAIWLSRIGYREQSRTVINLKDNAFGTGVIVETESGEKQLISVSKNVGIASKVTVETLNEKGVRNVQTGRKIITRASNGLVCIEMPKNHTTHGLKITERSATDGMDIYTFGYNDVNKKATWQMGDGIISNDRFIPNDTKDVLIQHTSPVNVGMYGSPLTIKRDSAPYGYEVMGINIHKGRDRENTNYAIPAQEIKQIISGIAGINSKKSKEALISSVEQLLKMEKENFSANKNLISDQYLTDVSNDVLQSWYNSMPESVKKEFEKDLNNEMVFESAKNIIAYAFAKDNIEGSQLKVKTCAYTSNSDVQTVQIDKGGKTLVSTWVYEDGNWELKSWGNNAAEKPKAKADANNADKMQRIGIDRDYTGIQLAIGTTFIPVDKFSSYTFTFSIINNPFVKHNLELGKNTAAIRVKDGSPEFNEHGMVFNPDGSPHYPFLDDEANLFSMDYSVAGQVPINLKRFFVVPQVAPGMGFIFGKSKEYHEIVGGFFFKLSSGAQLGYNISNTLNVFLYGGHQLDVFLIPDPEDEIDIKKSINGFNSRLGVMFVF